MEKPKQSGRSGLQLRHRGGGQYTLSDGVTASVRSGDKLPTSATILAAVSYWDTTVSNGPGQSKPAMGKRREARLPRSAQTASPLDSRQIISITPGVSSNVVSVVLELDSRFCGCIVVRKAGLHLADHRNEVSDQADDHSEDACEHEQYCHARARPGAYERLKELSERTAGGHGRLKDGIRQAPSQDHGHR